MAHISTGLDRQAGPTAGKSGGTEAQSAREPPRVGRWGQAKRRTDVAAMCPWPVTSRATDAIGQPRRTSPPSRARSSHSRACGDERRNRQTRDEGTASFQPLWELRARRPLAKDVVPSLSPGLHRQRREATPPRGVDQLQPAAAEREAQVEGDRVGADRERKPGVARRPPQGPRRPERPREAHPRARTARAASWSGGTWR